MGDRLTPTARRDALSGTPSHRFPLMSKRSITLVGRASRLQCHDDHVSFLLTVKAKVEQGEFVVECRAHRRCDIEAFESMDEGSLAGIIGTISLIPRNPHVIVRLDRLEILGKPLEVA